MYILKKFPQFKAVFALKSELEDHLDSEREAIKSIKEEISELKDLVQILRDQQYVISLLNEEVEEEENSKTKTDDDVRKITEEKQQSNNDNEGRKQKSEEGPKKLHEEILDLMRLLNATLHRIEPHEIEKDENNATKSFKDAIENIRQTKIHPELTNITTAFEAQKQKINRNLVGTPLVLPTTMKPLMYADVYGNIDDAKSHPKKKENEGDGFEKNFARSKGGKVNTKEARESEDSDDTSESFDLNRVVAELGRELEDTKAEKKKTDVKAKLKVILRRLEKEEGKKKEDAGSTLKTLEKFLKRIETDKESKALKDDGETLEEDLRDLQDAIENLRPKDEVFDGDFDEDAQEKSVLTVLSKLLAKPNFVKKKKNNLDVLKKLLFLAGNRVKPAIQESSVGNYGDDKGNGFDFGLAHGNYYDQKGVEKFNEIYSHISPISYSQTNGYGAANMYGVNRFIGNGYGGNGYGVNSYVVNRYGGANVLDGYGTNMYGINGNELNGLNANKYGANDYIPNIYIPKDYSPNFYSGPGGYVHPNLHSSAEPYSSSSTYNPTNAFNVHGYNSIGLGVNGYHAANKYNLVNGYNPLHQFFGYNQMNKQSSPNAYNEYNKNSKYNKMNGYNQQSKDGESNGQNFYQSNNQQSNGYYQDNYHSSSYDLNDHNSLGYKPNGYSLNNQNQIEFNSKAFGPNWHNQNGYNSHGYIPSSYNPIGYFSNSFSSNGYNPDSYNPSGYNPNNYNPNGYNTNGYHSNEPTSNSFNPSDYQHSKETNQHNNHQKFNYIKPSFTYIPTQDNQYTIQSPTALPTKETAYQKPNTIAPIQDNHYAEHNQIPQAQEYQNQFFLDSHQDHRHQNAEGAYKIQAVPNQEQPNYDPKQDKRKENLSQAAYGDQYQDNTQIGSEFGAGYAHRKAEDVKREIYNLQNVIDGLNRPEYTKTPEDRETVRALEKQIGELRQVVKGLDTGRRINDASEDVERQNGNGDGRRSGVDQSGRNVELANGGSQIDRVQNIGSRKGEDARKFDEGLHGNRIRNIGPVKNKKVRKLDDGRILDGRSPNNEQRNDSDQVGKRLSNVDQNVMRRNYGDPIVRLDVDQNGGYQNVRSEDREENYRRQNFEDENFDRGNNNGAQNYGFRNNEKFGRFEDQETTFHLLPSSSDLSVFGRVKRDGSHGTNKLSETKNEAADDEVNEKDDGAADHVNEKELDEAAEKLVSLLHSALEEEEEEEENSLSDLSERGNYEEKGESSEDANVPRLLDEKLQQLKKKLGTPSLEKNRFLHYRFKIPDGFKSRHANDVNARHHPEDVPHPRNYERRHHDVYTGYGNEGYRGYGKMTKRTKKEGFFEKIITKIIDKVVKAIKLATPEVLRAIIDALFDFGGLFDGGYEENDYGSGYGTYGDGHSYDGSSYSGSYGGSSYGGNFYGGIPYTRTSIDGSLFDGSSHDGNFYGGNLHGRYSDGRSSYDSGSKDYEVGGSKSKSAYDSNNKVASSRGMQIWKRQGLFGLIPMFIFKFFSSLGYFVKVLQQNKFIKTFLLPALVVLGISGMVIFLIWWLQPNEEPHNAYQISDGAYNKGYRNGQNSDKVRYDLGEYKNSMDQGKYGFRNVLNDHGFGWQKNSGYENGQSNYGQNSYKFLDGQSNYRNNHGYVNGQNNYGNNLRGQNLYSNQIDQNIHQNSDGADNFFYKNYYKSDLPQIYLAGKTT